MASIDRQLNDALMKIDKARRKRASRSLLDFINTYCVGVMIDEPLSGKMLEVIETM